MFMGYTTTYTVRIVATTQERRKQIASEIIKCAWLPYINRQLGNEEFLDPVLTFECRTWHMHMLMDLNGKWYDSHLRLPSGKGGVRGLLLENGEVVSVIAMGEEDADIRRIIANNKLLINQTGRVSFVDKQATCPIAEDDDENGNFSICSGCQGCASRQAIFDEVQINAATV